MAGGRQPRHYRTCAEPRKGTFKAYEEPKLDEGVNEALLDYIARRGREIRPRMSSIRAIKLMR